VPTLELGVDTDTEDRLAIWRAIQLASEQLAGRFPGFTVHPRWVSGESIPDLPPWLLVEGLSLLAILVRADDVLCRSVNLFTKEGPLEFTEESKSRFLWSQHAVRGELSALDGRPDLLVTDTNQPPDAKNVRKRSRPGWIAYSA
jgi:hypothetical protein